jgi:Icc-related predicted phosphoesterase
MRVLVISDIHLEFGPFSLPSNLSQFHVAIFAGDISRPLSAGVEWLGKLRQGFLEGKPIIYVPGNHEFYHEEYYNSLRIGQELAVSYGIELLAPGRMVIGGVRFIGCTLWTGFSLHGTPDMSRYAARHGMNDHQLIKIARNGRKRKFTPEDAARLHREEVGFLSNNLSGPFDGPTIVVTHHAPHPGSVQPRFQGDQLAPAYATDLSVLIDRFQPELWIHGHDHGSHDYTVGQTRVLANPAGYPLRGGGRENPTFIPGLVVDVAARV